MVDWLIIVIRKDKKGKKFWESFSSILIKWMFRTNIVETLASTPSRL